jgi:DNA-binding transcriptional MerR regulator
MNQFTISDIETLSGIKAQTLRVWEQRYGILIPKRKKSKHRIYDNEDLKEILSIAYLNRSGYKISKIAGMSPEERNRLTVVTNHNSNVFKELINQFIEAGIMLDEQQFQKIYQSLLPKFGLEQIILHVYYPLLLQIGKSWMGNQITPAHEHFISEQITRSIDIEIQKLPLIRQGEITLLVLPEGEYHRIPLLFIMYLMRKNGKRVIYLGANTELSIIQHYLSKKTATYLHFHLITDFFSTPKEKYIKKLITTFKDQKIIISGPVAASIQQEHTRLTKLTSMQALLNYILK